MSHVQACAGPVLIVVIITITTHSRCAVGVPVINHVFHYYFIASPAFPSTLHRGAKMCQAQVKLVKLVNVGQSINEPAYKSW